MLFFHIRRSGKRCKKNCDAYAIALLAAEKLHAKCKEVSVEAEQYNNIISFINRGGIILGISKRNTCNVITVLENDGGRKRTVSLYLLPYSEHDRRVCSMDLKYISKYRIAYIQDWYCEIENMGYGSILMTHLIAYLKMAGFHYLTGEICPVDFGHEDKLRHFYTKFKFEIKDYPDKRELKRRL